MVTTNPNRCKRHKQTVAPGLEIETWGNRLYSLWSGDQKMVMVLLSPTPGSYAYAVVAGGFAKPKQ